MRQLLGDPFLLVLLTPAQWLFAAATLMYVGTIRDIVAEVRGQ
ncbi:hypothetical protein [Kribbella alba]